MLRRLAALLPLLLAAPAAAAPTPSGTLSVAGTLQDGATLTAKGVSWTPAPCAGGTCSKVLTVGYRWQACGGGGSCGPMSTASTQPLLATQRLGPGDVGTTIRVVETATDVRTDDSEQTASVSADAAGPVAPWPAGRAPRVDFVAGLPEASTASTRERLLLSSPHANPADGAVTVACSVDGAPFSTACVGPRSVTTPVLGLGAHQVRVRASNAAGAQNARATWQVVDLPPPTPCGSCFHPPHLDATGHPMTWDWQLSVAGSDLTYRKVDLFDIDGFNNDASVVSGIHAHAGKTLPSEKAVCYLSLGSWENFRPDARSWPPAAIGRQLGGYPNERWVDVRRLSALQPVIDRRMQLCADKGFDGVEVDNIDGWSNQSGFPLTMEDAQPWLAAVANAAHARGLFVLWKNEPRLAQFGTRYFDGALSEQCYSYDECTPAQNAGANGCDLGSAQCGVALFAAQGKWVGEVEYPPGGGQPGVCTPSQSCSGKSSFATFCSTTYGGFGFAAWRANVDLDGKTFFPCWT